MQAGLQHKSNDRHKHKNITRGDLSDDFEQWTSCNNIDEM